MNATGWITLVLRGLVSSLLLLAAFEKLRDPAAFSQVIERYQLLRAWPSAILALYLPWLELLLAVAWWFPRVRRQAGVLIGGLLLVFSLALVAAWTRGLDIRCGCLGRALDLSLPLALARNLVLLAMVTGVLLVDSVRWSQSRRTRPGLL